MQYSTYIHTNDQKNERASVRTNERKMNIEHWNEYGSVATLKHRHAVWIVFVAFSLDSRKEKKNKKKLKRTQMMETANERQEDRMDA